MPTIKICVANDLGAERMLTLQANYEVCGRCEGEGSILNPSIGEHAYSQEEFDEAFDDEEDRQAYFQRGGKYDVQCPECKGRRVIPVLDRNQFYKPAHLKLLKRIDDDYKASRELEAEMAAEQRMERMMGGDF
jgi:hypothetical protein